MASGRGIFLTLEGALDVYVEDYAFAGFQVGFGVP